MKELEIKTLIWTTQKEELTGKEQELIDKAIEATHHSYSPYSHFSVGAAVLLHNGETVMGCNQENAAFPAGICAERSALFSAGSKYPDEPVIMLAIAARNAEGKLTRQPVSPCGSCRQVIIETEKRFRQPVRILLYGTDETYIVDGICQLMPLSFAEF